MWFYNNLKKFFLLVTLIIVAIILIHVFEPLLINNKKQNWQSELKIKNEEIKREVEKLFKVKEDSLFLTLKRVKEIVNSDNFLQEKIIPSINQESFSDYSIIIKDELNNIFAWTANVLVNDSLNSHNQNIGDVFIVKSNLTTYLAVTGLTKSDSNTLFITVLIPIEKEYKLHNKYFKNISLTEELSKKFNTQFVIKYSGIVTPTNDGRLFSFFVKYNGNKLALITFKKPTLDSEINEYRQTIKNIKFLLIIIVLTLFGIAFFPKFKKLHNPTTKFVISSTYLITFRTVIYLSGFMTSSIKWNFSNPAFFSSTFAFGIVKSPIELFITGVFVLAIVINLYLSIDKLIIQKTSSNKHRRFIQVTVFLVVLILFFLAYRAFAASIRSVIFDSTLIYFNDQSLFPNSTVALMYINILLVGIVFITVSLIIFLGLYAFFYKTKNFNVIKFLLFSFILFQLYGVFFDLFQSNPQGNSLIRILFITVIFLLLFLRIILEKRNLIILIYSVFAASFLSVILMIHYNNKLEDDSLRIYAQDLIRPNDGWIEFLVRESLLNEFTRKEALDVFNNSQSNFDAVAFKIWSKSSLQKESFISEISLLDYNKNFLGGFGFRVEEIPEPDWSKLENEIDDITIFQEKIPNSEGKIIRGIFPVKNDYALLGFVEASVIYDIGNFGFDEPPEFLRAPPLHPKLIVETGQLKILEFINDSLANVWGDIRISYPDIERINSIKLNKMNEAFRIVNLNGSDYKFYITEIFNKNNSKKIALAIKVKELSFQIFNYFKISFFHTLLILAVILIYLITQIFRRKTIVFSLQAKLLIAFLVVSIIPLILLALYFRNLTEQKNKDAIFYKLGKRAYSVETYSNEHLQSKVKNLYEVFEKASGDLNINFSVFNGKKVFYSTESLFYEINLLPKLINPMAFNTISNYGAQDYVTIDKIEKYKFNSFYYLGKIQNKYYVIQISDAFNNILLPMSGNEVDAFLVASYSLAVLLVLLLSTILANQISKPIRKLTQATKSVASGDLDIELKETSGNEIDDLVKGFNYMVKELKRNQAQLAEVEREAAWKEMAKQVAHEIKNPLTPMKLATQQLIAAYKDNSDKFEEIFKKVTGTIINQIETLSKIANEFSVFARMPSLKIERIDLRKVINDSLDLFIDEKVVIDFQSELKNFVINADYDQLKRTFINLIRNSIQANATEIKIELTEDNNSYYLRIKDNGYGISKEILPKIFNYNFSTKEKGMGIGLSLAKKYLEFIHASIQVENTGPGGTTILLKFKKLK